MSKYYTPFQVSVKKDEPYKPGKKGGEIVIELDRAGVKNFHKNPVEKVYDKSKNELQIRCTVDGTTYGYNFSLGGTVDDNIVVKPSNSSIKIYLIKTSDFTIRL